MASIKEYYGSKKEKSYLSSLTETSCLTDEEGNFQAYGKGTDKEIHLKAMKAGYYQVNSVRVPPGTKGALLVMRKAGKIQANFRTVPSLPLSRMTIDLLFRESGKKEKKIPPDRMEKNRALWEKLPPGEGTLEVFFPSWQWKEPVLTIPGIRVEEGKETHDPRLQDIDLLSRILVVDLKLKGITGKPIHSAWIRGGVHLAIIESCSPGRPTILPKLDPPEYWIDAKGYRPKKIRVGKPKMTVVLERGYKVRLAYTGKGPLPEEPYTLGVRLYPIRERKNGRIFPPFLRSADSFFRKDGILETRLPFPGKYRVSWMLKISRKGGWTAYGLPIKNPPVLQVRDVPATQAFDVSLPAEELEKALKNRKWGPPMAGSWKGGTSGG